ncbi:hypothetical protein [Dyella humicola]|nr:hypothetical protein [Dyella humicola]
MPAQQVQSHGDALGMVLMANFHEADIAQCPRQLPAGAGDDTGGD